MLLIDNNTIGKIFVSNTTINKIVKLNFNKMQSDITITRISSSVSLSNDVFIEVNVDIKKNNNEEETDVHNLDLLIFSLIKKILLNNFNNTAKNITIIYNFKRRNKDI